MYESYVYFRKCTVVGNGMSGFIRGIACIVFTSGTSATKENRSSKRTSPPSAAPSTGSRFDDAVDVRSDCGLRDTIRAFAATTPQMGWLIKRRIYNRFGNFEIAHYYFFLS
jgi:hypothetical protein